MREILRIFGVASGLHTNYAKCSISPIRCSEELSAEVSAALACPIAQFPITYLGLPLSLRKLPSSAFDSLIVRLQKKLPTWRAALLSRGERLALARHVLTAMPTHILAAIAQC